MKRFLYRFALLISCLSIVPLALYGQSADTIYVNSTTGSNGFNGLYPDSAKATIGAALDTVNAGGVVIVAAGTTYNEEVVVGTNGVRIQGQGSGATRPLIDNSNGAGNGNGIVISSGVSGVTIDNFRITAEITAISGDGDNNNTTVSNSELYYSQTGVELTSASTLSLVNNNIHDNGAGIVLNSISQSLIRNSTITDNGTGIRLDGSSYNTIWNNTISNNIFDTGIVLQNSSLNNSISYNDITNNDIGVLIDDASQSSDNVIAQNNITGSTTGLGVSVSSGTDYVNAQHNWWGHASGPTNENTNPSGTGDGVSDNVVFLYHKSAAITRNTSQTGPVLIGSTVYRSLSAALSIVNPGQTITIRTAGLYEGGGVNVYPDNVTIDGEGKDKSYLFFPYDYLNIVANNVTIQDIDIDFGGIFDQETGEWDSFLGHGYYMSVATEGTVTGTKILNNRIRGGQYGVRLSYTSSSVIDNNEIIWNSSNGVRSYWGASNTIKNNQMYHNGNVGGSETGVAAVRLDRESEAVILNNDIHDNVNHGIVLRTSSSLCLVKQNKVYNNGFYGWFWGSFSNPAGISLPDADENTVELNIVANNAKHGIQVGTYTTSYDNVFTGNTIGAATITTSFPPLNPADFQTRLGSPISNPIGITRKIAGDPDDVERAPQEIKELPYESRAVRKARLAREYQAARAEALSKRESREERIAADKARMAERSKVSAKLVGAQQREFLKNVAASQQKFKKEEAQAVAFPGNWVHGLRLYGAYSNIASGNTITDNGRSYGGGAGEGGGGEPAGVEIWGEYNLLSTNTIQANRFTGVKAQGNNNTIWNNLITGNGTATATGTGDGTQKGSGVFFNRWGGQYNSISANRITNNIGHGVRIDNQYGYSYDNVVAMNNITGNTVSGLTIEDPGAYNYLVNAQHNWWGSASGPSLTTNSTSGAQKVSEDVVYWFHKLAPLSLPVTQPGPVYNERLQRVYGSISDALNDGDMQDNDVIRVRMAGLYDDDPDTYHDGIQLLGAGKNSSYIYMPYGYFDINNGGVVVDGFDFDGGGFFDPVTGVQESINRDGANDYVFINVFGAGVTVRNNRIRGAWTGLYTEGNYPEDSETHGTYQNNEIFWNYYSGIYIDDQHNIVQNNLVYQNGHLEVEGYGVGIYIDNSYNTITLNMVSNNGGQGIYVEDDFNDVVGNTVGSATLSPSVPLPDNINWATVTPPLGKRVPSGDRDSRNPALNQKKAKQQSTTQTSQRKTSVASTLTREERKKARIQEEAITSAEKRAERLALRAARKEALQKERAAREAQHAQRLANSGTQSPSLKKSSTASITFPTIAPRTSLTGNSIHGMKVDYTDNLIANNVVKGNGAQYARTDGFNRPEPAGIEIEDGPFYEDEGPNIISGNTISDNFFTGIKLHDGAYLTVITGNTITGNGPNTSGNGSGIYFNKYGGNNNFIFLNTISNNGGHGIRTKSEATYSYNYENVIIANTIQSNGNIGVLIDNFNSGNLVQFNIIAGHTQFGVKNNSSASQYTLDARYGYWGTANGPGGAVNDPVTNKTANGTGNNVSANVRFDPFVAAIPNALAVATVPNSTDNADTVIVFGTTGVTANFSNTGSGGLVVVGSFNTTPPTGPFQDPSGGTNFQFLGKYWELLEYEALSGYTASITFSYAGISGLNNPGGLRVARRASFSGAGVTWQLIPLANTTINTTNQTITVTGITQLSQWTLVQLPAAPTVSSVTPPNGVRGQTITMSITGSNFFSGSTTVSLGSDITVSSVNVASSTQLQATLVISTQAVLGVRDVVVTNTLQGASTTVPSAFTVLNPAPVIFGLSPTSATRGSSTTVSVNGTGFIGASSGTTVSFGSGITVGSASVLGTSLVQAFITIPASTNAGPTTVTVSNPGPGGGSSSGSFTVTNPAPTITSISPNTGNRGQTLTVTVNGTGFFSNATTVSFGPDITVNSVSVSTQTSLSVSITIGAAAATGARNVTVTNATPGGGVASLANAFTVGTGVPSNVESIGDVIPTDFALMQNYPNPFNPSTSIRFALPERSAVKLVLYNTLGIEVSVLVDEQLEPGMYQYRLAADNLPTGMYIYTLKVNTSANGEGKSYTSSKKLLLVK